MKKGTLLMAGLLLFMVGSLEARTLSIHAVSFDGSRVRLADLPESLLEGTKDLKSGDLTRGNRYIRAQSIKTTHGDRCPVLEQSEKLAVDFSTTCRLKDPSPQKIDIWLPSSPQTRAALTVEIQSATDSGVSVAMKLEEKDIPTLEWSFDDIRGGSTVIFSFAKNSKGPVSGGPPTPSNLSDVIFVVIDYR